MRSKFFRSGQRVRMVDKSFDDKCDSPLWGGKHGKIAGTVHGTGIADGVQTVTICWDNGEERVLKSYRLAHHHTGPVGLAKELAMNIHEYTAPYEKYIGLLALALVVDHFMLGGRFTTRFRNLAEALVQRITDSLDKVVDKLKIEEVSDDSSQG